MGESERELELAALEARLGAFRPGASRLDRDRVMYRAGHGAALKEQAISGPRWAWPSAFAAMTSVAAALIVALVVEHQGGRVLPSGPAVDLAQETDTPSVERVVQETPSSTDIERPSTPATGESYWPNTSDPDALLALLPAGRTLSSEEVPWENIDPVWAAEAAGSAVSNRPVTYVKRRQMLLEELTPANSKYLTRTKS